MGYDLYGVGEREIAYGWDFFESLMKDSGMRVLCGNVTRGEKRQQIGDPYVVVDAGGVKVGFVHVLLQSAGDRRSYPLDKKGFNVEDAAEALEKVLPKVRKKCDMVVLIAHSPWGRLNELLKEVSGFDLVLCAHDAGLDRKIREIHGARLMRAGRRGQYVVKVTAVVDPEGQIKSLEGEPIPVKTSLPEDPAIAEMVKQATEEYNKMRRELTASRTQAESKKLKGDKFLGAAICSRCHQDIYDAWSNTRHASAFATLVEKGAESDSDCVSCHTTGHGKPTGFLPSTGGKSGSSEATAETTRSADANTDLRNVQCEACHGMGTYHDRTGGDFLKVTEAECARCHTKEHSPSFDYKDYLPSVSCVEIAHK